MIIAIDGPAASGKSSVAKMLASKINYSHFGTGIMYRALTAYAVNNNFRIGLHFQQPYLDIYWEFFEF